MTSLILIVSKEPHLVMKERNENRRKTIWIQGNFQILEKSFISQRWCLKRFQNRPQFTCEFKIFHILKEVLQEYGTGVKASHPLKDQVYIRIKLGYIVCQELNCQKLVISVNLVICDKNEFKYHQKTSSHRGLGNVPFLHQNKKIFRNGSRARDEWPERLTLVRATARAEVDGVQWCKIVRAIFSFWQHFWS